MYVYDLCQTEVARLCGPRYHPADKTKGFRGGHTVSRVPVLGDLVDLPRPRVRRLNPDGTSKEVQLKTQQILKRDPTMAVEMVRLAASGVSSREMKRAVKGRLGSGKSMVSKIWIKASLKMLVEFRERNHAAGNWLVLMLDGIHLSTDQHAVVALGVTADGHKQILDFEIGASENSIVTEALLQRVKQRGFGPMEGHRLLAVTDGADVLRNGVLKVWPDAVIQRCLVHKERNLRGYLSRKNWGELARLMKRIRQVQGNDAGQAAMSELKKWLSGINALATKSVEEAGADFLALHRLGVPNTLHTSLLSTNLIENPFRNVRRKIGRVARFDPATDQAARWLAFALMEAERGFRSIRHAEDLPALKEALRLKPAGPAGPHDFPRASAQGSADSALHSSSGKIDPLTKGGASD